MPYGPGTPLVRRFLQRLAGLSATDETEVVARYAAQSLAPEYATAEMALGLSISRTGRVAEQTALAGPLLQLVRERADESGADGDASVLPTLRAIAEPALAALLALMMRDVLQPFEFTRLYEPFDTVLQVSELR
jgi:hypothetical protein